MNTMYVGDKKFNTTLLEHLVFGEAFLHNKNLYIKTNAVTEDDSYTCVNLANGCICNYAGNIWVNTIDATVHWEKMGG